MKPIHMHITHRSTFKYLAQREIKTHVLRCEVFSCLRSSNGTAHTLLSFSPLHHWLIILSHSMEAVNDDTHYKSGVKDGWRRLHSLFI